MRRYALALLAAACLLASCASGAGKRDETLGAAIDAILQAKSYCAGPVAPDANASLCDDTIFNSPDRTLHNDRQHDAVRVVIGNVMMQQRAGSWTMNRLSTPLDPTRLVLEGLRRSPHLREFKRDGDVFDVQYQTEGRDVTVRIVVAPSRPGRAPVLSSIEYQSVDDEAVVSLSRRFDHLDDAPRVTVPPELADAYDRCVAARPARPVCAT